MRDRCRVCGLDLRAHDSGDGPASLLVFALATIVALLAIWVEFRFSPPLWVHVVVWPVVTVPLGIGMMRPFKAALVALQWRYRGTAMNEEDAP